jgi:DNA-binding XRE family transcriptional regulator
LPGPRYGCQSCQEEVRKPYADIDKFDLAYKCIDDVDPKKIRRNRGSDTFAKYPQYRLQIPRRIIPPKGYPLEPRFLSEHIRKRRLDLGLLQVEVATEIGVTESTVWNWEHVTQPELIHIPAVLALLGYGS